jgi:cytidylate kinase
MTELAPVITVDGPVGTGKGTVTQRVAGELDWHILDSGAIYRLLALSALRAGVASDDIDGLVQLSGRLEMAFVAGDQDEPVRVMLDGHNVSDEIRTEECGEAASRLAPHPPVRAALLERQHGFRELPGLVADGRDMGTVVFPDAELKLFLTASPEERAERRYKQLIAKGIGGSLANLLEDINNRDKRDRERAIAPLKPAEDAVVIDTTGKTIATVVQLAMDLVSSKRLIGP